MLKYPQIALSWLLYWIGHAASIVLERWVFDEDDEERDPPPLKHTIVWSVYQWCMTTSARLDKWDAIWSTPSGD